MIKFEKKNENVCAVFIHVINPNTKWKKTLINKNTDDEYFGNIDIWNLIINMMKYVYLGVPLSMLFTQATLHARYIVFVLLQN